MLIYGKSHKDPDGENMKGEYYGRERKVGKNKENNCVNSCFDFNMCFGGIKKEKEINRKAVK